MKRLAILGTLLGFLLAPGASHALSQCSVNVHKRTGVILVSALGVAGPLRWGSTSGGEANAFSNAATCVANGEASKCRLGATTPVVTAEAITPPPLCTIYVSDGVEECSAFVPGCTPGVRSTPPSPFGSNTVVPQRGDSGNACVLGEVWLVAGTIYPANAVPANGQLLQAAQYSALYNVLFNTYGGNIAQGTFSLPDLRAAAPNGLTYVICVIGTFP
jgi:hypothetical protein